MDETPKQIDTVALEYLLRDAHRALNALLPYSDEKRADEQIVQRLQNAIVDLTIHNRNG
jgi:hypothetical protein